MHETWESDFEDLGFARVDYDRLRRRGHPEAIFCPGKTIDQILHIADGLVRSGAENILATRASAEVTRALAKTFSDALVIAEAGLCVLNPVARPGIGSVAVVARRHEYVSVAQEAAFTAETMGSRVVRRFDAPLEAPNRLPDWVTSFESPNVIVSVDGGGGSLPSIVAGLSKCLVIAVPTSAGHLRGIPSLLAALNSCVPGVLTVNIDNGFGAGYAAHVVNAMALEAESPTTSNLIGASEGGIRWE